MENKATVNNGVETAPGWGERIRAAQAVLVYHINGQPFPRVRYGDEAEDWGAGQRPCHDCGGVRGQYHVRGGGGARCPRWGRRAISCGCSYDDEPTALRGANGAPATGNGA